MILHPAEKKGYSGVSTISRVDMKEIGRGMKGSLDPEDSEGRVLVTQHGDITLVNTYLPSGSSKEERQRYKEDWMAQWRDFIKPMFDSDKPVIVAGDSISHILKTIFGMRKETPNRVDFYHMRGSGSPIYLKMDGTICLESMLVQTSRFTPGGQIEDRPALRTEDGELITS